MCDLEAKVMIERQEEIQKDFEKVKILSVRSQRRPKMQALTLLYKIQQQAKAFNLSLPEGFDDAWEYLEKETGTKAMIVNKV